MICMNLGVIFSTSDHTVSRCSNALFLFLLWKWEWISFHIMHAHDLILHSLCNSKNISSNNLHTFPVRVGVRSTKYKIYLLVIFFFFFLKATEPLLVFTNSLPHGTIYGFLGLVLTVHFDCLENIELPGNFQALANLIGGWCIRKHCKRTWHQAN